MNRVERTHVERLRSSADHLLEAKTRGQEHAARYLLTIAIRQLMYWAEQAAVDGEDAQATEGKVI